MKCDVFREMTILNLVVLRNTRIQLIFDLLLGTLAAESRQVLLRHDLLKTG